MTEGIFMLLGGILIGCVAGYNAGRRAASGARRALRH